MLFLFTYRIETAKERQYFGCYWPTVLLTIIYKKSTSQ